jgi:hypothetical protein
MKQRVYIDTSVIGGCFDDEFEIWSNMLFDDFKSGIRIAVVSDITIDELSDAPQIVQDNFKTISDESLEVIFADSEVKRLADLYIRDKAVSEKFIEDALHIAVATINKVNVLASWNFKHIVNLNRIRQYNAVNLKNGYQILEIRTPREIINFDKDED